MSKISDRLHLAFMHEADVVIAARAYEASAANTAADKRDAIRYSIIADWNAAIEAMKHARNNLVALIEESQGIAGYHLNGEIALWDYFEEDDWLGIGQMERALARMEGTDEHDDPR